VADQPDGGEATAAGSGWAQATLPGQDEPGAREQDVLPDPVPREAERALAWFGVLGEGAAPVLTAGTKVPLAGLLLALPALAAIGLIESAAKCTVGCATGSTGWRRS
jgi:hypothetical protein